MFYRIEDRMAKDLKLSVYELLIYGVIYSSQNQTYVWGQNYLSEITWITIATLKRALKNMIEKWLIIKVSHWYQIVSQWYQKVSEWAVEENIEKYQSDTEKYQSDTKKVSEWATYINTKITEDIKEEIKEEKKPKENELSVSNLVKEFEKNDRLMKLYGWTDTVREWLEYKQAKKDRAYKTVKWFIQQMQVIFKDIQHWQPRGDIPRRFEFAVNQAMENNWKWIFRDEKIEAKYQNFKSMNKQNE